MNQDRKFRVADRVREELARAVREDLRDPRVGFVTITAVRLSADLRHARVHVSLFGEDIEERIDILRRAAPFLRRSLAATAGLKHTPELRFEQDTTAGDAERMERIFDAERPADDETP